jgi:quercetin dioxygenase-like cupin family protein
MSRVLPFVLAALLLASCAPGTPRNPIQPAGSSPTPLPVPEYIGIGKYQQLADATFPPRIGGVPFITFVEVRQPKESIFVNQDGPGFIYALQGTHAISRNDGERVSTLEQGKAMWVDGSDYSHQSGEPSDQVWYFISLRSITERGKPLPYPSAKLLYQSDDLQTTPPGKKIVHQLGYITMEAGGRTSAHTHGGTEAFFVMKGSVELKASDGRKVQLGEGQGASINPGVVMQLRVIGDRPVQILTYFVTPEGAPWQTNVQTLP